MKSARLVLCLFALALGGCATTTYSFRPGDNRVVTAIQGPLRDLGVMREQPPDILTRAVADPYALPSGFDCSAALAEIAALDQVLGPDVSLPGEGDEDMSFDPPGLLAGAIGGTISLPYSSIIRRLTGAAHRDRMLRGAILAGMVRRAFLNGVVLASSCAANGTGDSAIPPAAPPAVSAAPKTPTKGSDPAVRVPRMQAVARMRSHGSRAAPHARKVKGTP